MKKGKMNKSVKNFLLFVIIVLSLIAIIKLSY